MFLDDELFNVCKKSKLITVEDVHNTTRQVYRHCEYYVKSKKTRIGRVHLKSWFDHPASLPGFFN
jgi:hypothetical protein